MLKPYKVISENFWDGVQMHLKGSKVDIETDDVQVAWNSRSLQPIGDSPVFETRPVAGSPGELERVKSSRKPKAGKAPEPAVPPGAGPAAPPAA